MFSIQNPLNELNKEQNYKIFDSHVHIWAQRYFKEFKDYIQKFGVKKILGMGSIGLKKKLEKLGLDNSVIFSYYLSSQDFIKYETEKLIQQIDNAQKNDIRILKIFFGPRFLIFSRNITPFRINDPKLAPVYSLIEEYEMTVLMHVADPDIWYQKKYKNTAKYGTKNERIEDFSQILDTYSKIKMISAHLGSLPEDLQKLGELFDKFPQLFVDTASTRWMIRELGKDINKTKQWIAKYQDRILFGSDLGNIEFHPKFFFKKSRREFFWASRYWSQRLFWETSHQTPLPFRDKDNPERTIINGLNLSKSILEKIYYSNALKLFPDN
ncbi:MAG: amidohydrolase family protein [Candidatus Hodarchaeales archaeon]|jgi:hypothetical protein